MYRTTLLLCLCLNVWPILGQTFNRRYDLLGNGNAQTAWGIERAGPVDHLIIAASSETDSLGPNLFFSYYALGLTRIDGEGDVVWERRFTYPWHGVTPGWANCCDTVPPNGYIVGGARQDTLQNLEVYLIRLDANGDTLWTRAFGGIGQQWIGRQVKHTPEGGFIVVGETDATGYIDGFALKTDANGNEEWRRTYGGSQFDGLVSADPLLNGEYLLGGISTTSSNGKEHWVLRVDDAGGVIWNRTWGGTYDDPNAQNSIASNGDLIVASARGLAPEYASIRPYLARLMQQDGSIIWDRQYGAASLGSLFFTVKEDPNTDLIACGVSYEGGPQKGLLLRTTAAGDSLWMRSYFYADDLVTTGVGRFYDVLPTPEGGFIATGPVYSQLNMPNPPGYSQDAWVVKVDGYGCIVPGCQLLDGVQEQATNLLDAFSFYPNPAHGSATVQLSLPPSVSGALELTLVAMDGRVVARERLPSGNGSFPLSLSDLGPGLYYAHIAQGGKWLTGGKLVVE